MAGSTYTVEIEVEIDIVSKGYPATGPTYDSGGEPAEGPEFEIGSIIVGGEPLKTGEKLGDVIVARALEWAYENTTDFIEDREYERD